MPPFRFLVKFLHHFTHICLSTYATTLIMLDDMMFPSSHSARRQDILIKITGIDIIRCPSGYRVHQCTEYMSLCALRWWLLIFPMILPDWLALPTMQSRRCRHRQYVAKPLRKNYLQLYASNIVITGELMPESLIKYRLMPSRKAYLCLPARQAQERSLRWFELRLGDAEISFRDDISIVSIQHKIAYTLQNTINSYRQCNAQSILTLIYCLFSSR